MRRLGGYHYFLPTAQESNLRHGFRGYASVGYTQKSLSVGEVYDNISARIHFIPVSIGADYTLDFNARDKFARGIFTGANIGFLGASLKVTRATSILVDDDDYGFKWDWHCGGSLTISDKHRVELAFSIGSGFSSGDFIIPFIITSLRYVVLF